MTERFDHQGLHIALRAAAALLVVIGAIWAVSPRGKDLGTFDPEAFIDLPEQPDGSEESVVSIDPGAFDVTLWYAPPPPPEPEPEPEPRAPAKVTIELLAISSAMNEDGVLEPIAIVYDTEDDTVEALGVGTAHKGQTITAIDAGIVTVRVGSGTVDLTLEIAGAG